MTIDILDSSHLVASFTNKPSELKQFLFAYKIKLTILEVRSNKFKVYGIKKDKNEKAINNPIGGK